MKDSVRKFIEETIEIELQDIAQYKYSKEHIEKLVESYRKSLQKQYDFIVNKDLEKDVEYSKDFFALYTNVNNKRTNKFFELTTDIVSGKNKAARVKTFRNYFGTYLDEVEKIEKNEALKKIEIEKEEKKNEILEYFNSDLWDKEKVARLSPMQIGRIRKALDVEYNWNGFISSLKDVLINLELKDESKEMTNNMHKWNRKKVNQMSSYQEEEYKSKLIAGRTYYFGNYQIPKIVFDIINAKDITDIEKLEE